MLARRALDVLDHLLARARSCFSCLSHVPLLSGYHEPATLSYQITLFGPIGPDDGHPGDAVCCMPEDIHSVWDNGAELAVSLHTYGRHLNHTGRSVFDVAAKSEMPCVVKVDE